MADPSTPTPPQTGEETARELLAATVDRVAFPGKAEWILAGHDDVLIDGKDAIRAILSALGPPPTEVRVQITPEINDALHKAMLDSFEVVYDLASLALRSHLIGTGNG